MSPYLAEFFGTMLLILLGGGVNAAVSLRKSKSENGGWLMITIGWGLAVMLAIYAVGNISGAHLNPAVTIALAINGSFATDLVIGYILAQFAGAIAGASLVWLHYLPHWKETTDPATKLGVFCNAPAIQNTFSNLISEIIATMVLILALLFIGANQFTQGLSPIVVGLLII
ncbi:MAG: MIP/aquaporin family protein, partial [Cyclobacteriaceae bacterium]